MTDDVVTQATRVILDALQPHEWWSTSAPNVVVVSLDGDTAIRLTVARAVLPEESPYETGDNRYPVQPEPHIRERLEYLRGELQAQRISWGELNELQNLAAYIEPGDVELLEAAGVPEFPAEEDDE